MKTIEQFIKEFKDVNFREIFKQNKELLLQQEISPSRINTFINSKSKFILSYLFNIKYRNLRMVFGKLTEIYFMQRITRNDFDFDKYFLENSNDIVELSEEEYQKNYNEEEKDFRNCISIIDNEVLKIFNSYRVDFYNNPIIYKYKDKKFDSEIKFIPDFVLHDNENKPTILEFKYTKKMPSLDYLRISHLRQLLIYKTLLKEMYNNSIKSYIIYTTPKKYMILDVMDDLPMEYMKDTIKEFYKFVKDLTFSTALYILQNEIESFYIGDIEKEIINLVLDKKSSVFIKPSINILYQSEEKTKKENNSVLTKTIL